jgi:transglutaminase-like putative cysteine protease
MAKLVKQYKTTQPIRELALRIVRDVQEKNWLAETRAIHDFCRDRIRYVKDVHNVETLQTPLKTLELKQGDCDDKTTLFCSLLASIGHPTRMVAMAFNDAKNFSHVAPQAKIGARWIMAECTQPWPLGQNPKNVTAQMIAHN